MVGRDIIPGLESPKLTQDLESKLRYNAAQVEESLQNLLQHHNLGIRLWRHVGMGTKEDKVLKEGHLWYVSITYLILGEVGDEITMETRRWRGSRPSGSRRVS